MKLKKKLKSEKKIARVFKEWGEGKLHSGSKNGPLVTKGDRKQAIAIALSEGKKAAGKKQKRIKDKRTYIRTA